MYEYNNVNIEESRLYWTGFLEEKRNYRNNQIEVLKKYHLARLIQQALEATKKPEN